MQLSIYQCDRCGADCSAYENRVRVYSPYSERYDLCIKCAREISPRERKARCAMKIENGKIVEATVSELFDRWLSSDHCEIYPFDYYKWLCQEKGMKIINKETK